MMRPGFTLIETLIYIGLFSILMQGAVASLYSIQMNNSYLDTDSRIYREERWIHAVFEKYTQDSSAHEITIGSAGSQITFHTEQGEKTVGTLRGTLTESAHSTSYEISGNDVQIMDFHATNNATSSGPAVLILTFTLNAFADNGMMRSNTFEERYYPIP